MYQVFYIDSEEEITSIIDRLRKSKSTDNYFVIPVRALVLSSIVSLKLLKSKADELKKNVIVITQDAQGKDLAKKAGFLVKENMEGIEVSSDTVHASMQKSEGVGESIGERGVHLNIDADDAGVQKTVPTHGFGQARSMGEIRPASSRAAEASGMPKEVEIERPIQEAGGVGMAGEEYSVPIHGPQEPGDYSQGMGMEGGEFGAGGRSEVVDVREGIEDLSSKDVSDQPKKKFAHKNVLTPRVKLIFVSFLILCVLLIAGISAYLFLPKADIYVFPQSALEKIDLSVRAQIGSAGIDLKNRTIEAKLIEVNDSIIINRNSTGEEFASNQKARGKVKIFNEYSEEDQQLVATTRLETKDGKIFRIIEGVTVPGMKEKDGKKVPGSVEVEVVADKSGEEYNIGPSKFTIPGFKGGAKYEKFYAESERKMLGGGSEGEKVKIVSESDVFAAKEEAERQLRENILGKMEESLEIGYVLDSETIKTEIVSSGSFPVKNSVADSFEYQLEMKVFAMVFSEDDVVDLIRAVVEEKLGENETDLELTDVRIEYGQISSDFDSQLLDVSVHADVELQSRIDEEKIVDEFLGVKQDELGPVVDANLGIQRIEVTLWPDVLTNSIPKKKDRVKIYIQREE